LVKRGVPVSRRSKPKKASAENLYRVLMEKRLVSTTCDTCPYRKTCPFYKEGSPCILLKDLIGTMEGLELDKIRDNPEKLVDIVGAIIQAKITDLTLIRMQQSMMGIQSSKTIREEEKLLLQWIRIAMDLLKSMGITSERKEIDAKMLLVGLFKQSVEKSQREPLEVRAPVD